MKKLFISLSTASILLVSGLSFAWGTVTCPSTSDIQARGFGITRNTEHGYMSMNMTDYPNTSHSWVFAMGFFDAKDRQDANTQAKAAFSTLSGEGHLTSLEDGTQACRYTVSAKGKYGNPIVAIAMIAD